jgi:hypothetical protein
MTEYWHPAAPGRAHLLSWIAVRGLRRPGGVHQRRGGSAQAERVQVPGACASGGPGHYRSGRQKPEAIA